MSFQISLLPALTCDHPEARSSCEQGIFIVYDDGKIGGWPIGRIDYSDPANAAYKDKYDHNWIPPPFPSPPHALPVRPPLPTEISKVPFRCTPETYYDCSITPYTDSSGKVLGHKESCKRKPDVKDDFTKADVCGATIPFYKYDDYITTETLPVPVAVPITEPTPCFFPASAEQKALTINENLKKTNPKNPPRYIPPPKPEIPDVTYDEKKDKKKRKKKISLAVEPISLPVVSDEQKHSFDDPEPVIPPENVNTTTEDKTYDTIYKIGMFVAIAGIVYLLFNPTKNTNPGKDLGENAAFQGLSEL